MRWLRNLWRRLFEPRTAVRHPWFETCEHGVQFLSECPDCPGGCPQVGGR